MKKGFLKGLVGIMLIFLVGGMIFAEGQKETEKPYPSENIYILSSSGVGGAVDTTLRMMQPFLEKELGVSIIIDNDGSSGGRQATTRIYRAKPDGYSIVASAVPGVQVGQILYNPAYDLAKMVPVAAWIGGDLRAFTVGVDSPLKTWADVVALSKRRKLKVSGTGIGSVASLQSAILAEVVGIDHIYVPYESGGRSQAAVMSGEVDLAMTSGASALPAVLAGNVRLIGFFGYEELKEFPGAYPISKDFPDAFFESSVGAYAPPGTPLEVVKKLSDAFVKAASNPQFQEMAKNAGQNVLVRDHEEWTRVSKNYLDLVIRTKDLMMAQMQ